MFLVAFLLKTALDLTLLSASVLLVKGGELFVTLIVTITITISFFFFQIIPQGQQVFPVHPVQAPMIRYVGHTGATHIPHQASRVTPSFPQQDGVGYVIGKNNFLELEILYHWSR